VFRKDACHYYRAIPLEGFQWLEHGFGTHDSHPRPGHWEVASLRQVHSDRVVVVDGAAGRLGPGDALITDRPGCLLQVHTADCLPILLVDERRRAVAAIHAGWRGTAAGIAAGAVQRLCAELACHQRDLHAAIGPGIGACCYEVGSEVARQFQGFFPGLATAGRRVKLDLLEANCLDLTGAGLQPDRIYRAGLCTCCRPGEFHSWRRDGPGAGRVLSVVGIRP